MYLKADEEKSPIFRKAYAAMKSGSNKPEDVPRDVWKTAEAIAKVLRDPKTGAEKKKGLDYQEGPDGYYQMMEKLPDGTSRTPKVPLDDDWLQWLNFKEKGKQPNKLTMFNALCTPFMCKPARRASNSLRAGPHRSCSHWVRVSSRRLQVQVHIWTHRFRRRRR